MTIAARPQGLSDVAAGRLDRKTIDANFSRPAPAAQPARGEGRGRPLLFLLRRARASRPARPRSTSRCSSARSPPAIRSARPRRFSTPTSWAACARASARPRRLCEEACVREAAEGKPVRIGLLQRHADRRADGDRQARPSRRAAPTGKRVADRRRGPGGPRLRPRARASPAIEVDDLRGAREARRAQRIRHRRLQDARRFRRQGGRLHPVDRRDRGASTASRSARDVTLDAAAPRLRRGVSRHRPRRDQQARPARRDRTRQRRRRGRLHRRAASGGGPDHAAGRPARRRHRRRHDGDRRRRAVEAARRRERDDRLSARRRST